MTCSPSQDDAQRVLSYSVKRSDVTKIPLNGYSVKNVPPPYFIVLAISVKTFLRLGANSTQTALLQRIHMDQHLELVYLLSFVIL